ncbi:sigma-70 family RNA polymerase sigma factor [Flavobacteriaceae bacterium GF1]
MNQTLRQEYNSLPIRRGNFDFKTYNDRVIWDEFRAGSEEAFNFIYSDNFNALHHFCSRFSNCDSVIQDCIQDLFITIHKNRKNLGPAHSIKAYLFLSAKRKLTRYLKKEERFTSFGLENHKIQDKLGSEMPFEFTLTSNHPDEKKKEMLKKSFEKLPENQRKAIRLFYYENYSYKQVAEFMGMTNIKSARNLMYKALNNLKESF